MPNLTLIQGGNEPVIKPTLLTSNEGKLVMQCALGPYTASLVLPDEVAKGSVQEIQAFVESVVPEMQRNLVQMRNEENRKNRRKGKK